MKLYINMRSTSILLVLGVASFDEDFEIDEAEGHEAQSEAGHQPCKANQPHAYH